MRGKRAELPGKDILFGGPPVPDAEEAEQAVEPEPIPDPDPVPVAEIEEAPATTPTRPRRAPSASKTAGPPSRGRPRRQAAPVERAKPLTAPAVEEVGEEASTPHIQLCVWIDPALNDRIDRLRARFLLEYGAKVTKSQIVESILAEALADEEYVEGLVL